MFSSNDTYKVAIYMRLSRDDKETEESESISNQRSFIMDYVKENNLVVVDEYIDRNISGTTFDRPEFNRLIEDIEAKRVNMLITKDLSRLGREQGDSIYYIEKYFPEKSVRYVALNDGVDTYIDCVANEMVGFKSVMNEFYAKDISKKIKASLYTKKKQGKFLGGHAPYGYIKDPKDKYHLVIDPTASEVVKTIYKMFLDGNSLQKISRYLSNKKIPRPSVHKKMDYKYSQKTKEIWDERTIDDILKNPNYTGDLVQCRRRKISHKSNKIIKLPKEHWIVVENTHDAIIDKDTFENVQDIYEKNRNLKFDSLNLLLKGFIYCKECEHRVGINTSKDKKRHYTVCNHYRKYSKHNFCTPHTLRYETLETEVLRAIRNMCKEYLDTSKFEDIVKNNPKKKSLINELEKRIKSTSNEIESINNKLTRAYLEKLDDEITSEMYGKAKDMLSNDLENSEAVLKNLETQLVSLKKNQIPDDKKTKAKIEEYLSFKKPSRNLLASIIDKIVIDEDKNVEIFYKIKPVF